MRLSKEKRGRRGGLTRAGEFYHSAKCGVWYTARSVLDFFLAKNVQLDYEEARSIFDSLRRSKCYPCDEARKEKGSKGRPIPTIRFTHKTLNTIDLPPAIKNRLNDLECESVSDLIMSQLNKSDFGQALKLKVLKLKPTDPQLARIAENHTNGVPVFVDGGFYAIEAYELKGGDVKLILKKTSALRGILIKAREAALGLIDRVAGYSQTLKQAITSKKNGKAIRFGVAPIMFASLHLYLERIPISLVEVRPLYSEKNIIYT